MSHIIHFGDTAETAIAPKIGTEISQKKKVTKASVSKSEKLSHQQQKQAHYNYNDNVTSQYFSQQRSQDNFPFFLQARLELLQEEQWSETQR